MKSNSMERIVDLLGRAFRPLLPWLFLALRRALLATLIAVIVAVMLFVVPQSREVLHGLTELPLRSMQASEIGSLINHWGYFFYVCTSVMLGLATWYSARLLCTVEAEVATPRALEKGAEFASLQCAMTWLPRILGVFVLAAAIGAVIYASYTPERSRAEALALITTAIAGPLTMAAGRKAGTRIVQYLGLLVMTAGIMALLDCWL
jgi:hypothetical protein